MGHSRSTGWAFVAAVSLACVAAACTDAADRPNGIPDSGVSPDSSTTLATDGGASSDASGRPDQTGPQPSDGDGSGSSDAGPDEMRPSDAPSSDSLANGDLRDASSPDASVGPGPNITLNPFTNVYAFGDHDGGSMRAFDVAVTFPPMPSTYRSIALKIALRCPNAGPRSCDYVDQRGFVGIVQQTGNVERVYEIQRFITPYGSPAVFTADVTSLRPLLSGPVTLRLWVDTWAHAGSNIGDGWRVDVSFDFVGGVPARLPIAVVPLWGETIFDYGDPKKPVTSSVLPTSFTIPAEAKGVELRSFITGHGQGNLENCGEFCPKTHAFTLGGRTFFRSVWRTDCRTTTSPNQTSNAFMYDRAGWCPGATVVPWVQDVTAAAPAGQAGEVSYDVQAWTNTCQPDICTLMSCAFYGTPYFNGSCVYDQQFHAVPYYVLSSMLVVYGN